MQFKLIKKKKFMISTLLLVLVFSFMQRGINDSIAALGDEDSFENNDTILSPWHISLNYYTGLFLADEDWFSFSISSGQTISIEILFLHSECDIDIELYNENDIVDEGSYRVSNFENIEFTSTSDQILKLRIYAANGYSNVASYSLEISIDDDNFEENDSFEEAAVINNFWYYSDLVQNDDDWYAFWIDSYDELEIQLFYDVYFTEFNISVYNPAGTLVQNGYNQTYGENYKGFIYTNDGYGKYIYLRVNGTNIGSFYDLSIFINGFHSVPDDHYEENDTWQNSPIIYVDSNYNGLSQFDDDWYQIELYSDINLEINCYYNIGFTYMYLQLYDEWNNLLNYNVQDDLNNNRVQLNYQNGNSYQIVYLRVWGENTGNWYNLELNARNDAISDWIEFEEDDWAKWDVKIQTFNLENEKEMYIGTLDASINEITVSSDFLEVIVDLSWDNIPRKFIDVTTEYRYTFSIDESGVPSPPYFGFCSLFVGTDFSYEQNNNLFEFSGIDVQVFNNGLSIIIENNNDNSANNPWSKTTIHYTETGMLMEFTTEFDFYDEDDHYIGISEIRYTLIDSSIDFGSTGDENPFAIPGFPIEIFSLFSVGILSILVKKKK